MPPNEHVLQKGLEALQQVELVSFTATPSSIGPFGQSELRWRVNAPPSVTIKLDGRIVPKTGSQIVRPAESRSFKLTAHTVGLSAQVGQLTVEVDVGSCIFLFVPEADVQAALRDVVISLMVESPQISNRVAPFIDVTPEGIVLKLRFEIEVDNARNPDFNVDAVIGLGIDRDGLVPFFRQFSADLDFSFWEDVLNFTVGAFVGGPFLHLAIAIAESNAQDAARRDILEGVRAAIDGFLGGLEPGWAPQHVRLRDDGIEVRVCPRPGLTRVTSFRHPGFRLATADAGGPTRGVPGTTKARRSSALPSKRGRSSKRGYRR
jgi:hypothetical protein